jgi:TolB-like protein
MDLSDYGVSTGQRYGISQITIKPWRNTMRSGAKLLVISSLLLSSACVPYTVSNQSHADTQLFGLESGQRYIVTDTMSIQPASNSAGKFNSQVIFLADQLEKNADRKSLGNTFIITSFSNLDNLAETTTLGRLLSESLIHELQVRKWQVFDVRLTKDVIVNPSGEFSLSRDINKIRDTYKVGGVVTGTYTNVEGNIIVNGRAIDTNTGIVISSAQARLNNNWFTDALLFNQNALREMRIVGERSK